MTKKEFEDRIGYTVSDTVFEKANSVYMAVDLDKNDFAGFYEPLFNNPIINQLISKIDKLIEDNERLNSELGQYDKRLFEKEESFGQFLIELLEDNDEDTIRNKAIEILGKRRYIRYKIKNKYELYRDDLTILEEFI